MPVSQERFEQYKRLKTGGVNMARYETYKAQKQAQEAQGGAVDAYGRPIAKAEQIREEYPSETFSRYAEPISQFGGMFAKTPGMGSAIAGATTMGAEIAKQGIQALGSEPGTPKTMSESGRRIASAFGRGAGGELLARGAFRGAEAISGKVTPGLVKTASQAMKVSAGIPEKQGIKALTRPEVLTTPIEEAGKQYARAMEATGLRQGPEAAMELAGKSMFAQGGAESFAYDALQKLAKGELTYQEALVARDQLKNILKMPKFQNPSLAQNEQFIVKMRDKLDAYLEPYFTEAGESFAKARKDYSDAMTAKEFQSWFPTNANKTASVLRSGAAATIGGLGYGGVIDPETAVVGLALASPRMLGYGIRAGAAAAPLIKGGAQVGSRLAGQYMAGQALPSSTQTADEIKAAYKRGDLSREQAAQMLRTNYGNKFK